MKNSSMALTSPTRQEDLDLLLTWAGIIETTYTSYKRNPTPEKKAYLDSFISAYETLKTKIDTKDYTSDDARYWQSEAFYKALMLSPIH